MSNINDVNNLNSTSNFINETYDKLSYFDLYGNSVIIFIFMTLFVFLVYSYCKIMQHKEEIAGDWVNQRCKPQNIAFAGQITHPEGVSAFDYTNQNFQYCIQNILMNIAEYSLAPFQFMISALTDVFSEFSDAIQQIRVVFFKLRNGVTEFSEDVMNRILNLMTPIQTMFIALIDAFNKIQGVMTSGLYTMLGTYYTLQSLMGAILELIVKVLLALVIIIVALWILPFTWPVASMMSVVFLGIAIPLAIIIYFMTEVLHVKASAIPMLRCFDKNTKIPLKNGIHIPICETKLGDVLLDDSIITSKIKVLAKGLDMYNLNGIFVSESHILKYKNNWIPVKKHPEAIKIEMYDEPYLYCLNTSNKKIKLNEIIFTDWDEIYDDKLDTILKYKNINTTENISQILYKGFSEDTLIKLKNEMKPINEICIGDQLSTGGVVYGIVNLNKNNLGNNKDLYHLLTSNKYFETINNLEEDFNFIIDSIKDSKKQQFIGNLQFRSRL